MDCNRVIFSASFDCNFCCKNPFCRERKRPVGCGCWNSNCNHKTNHKPRCCFANCACVDDFRDDCDKDKKDKHDKNYCCCCFNNW